MLTSVKNEKVKQWRKLHKKKSRDQTKTFIVEGFHLVEEAHYSDWEIEEIIYQTGVEVPEAWIHYPCHEVSDHVMDAVSTTQTPQGVIAVVKKKHATNRVIKRALLVDQVQDPGNLGTMIRTADAAGFDTVMLGKGTVDLFNDKVLRSTQGSLFHLEILEVDLLEELETLKKADITVWATGLDNANYYHQLPVPNKLAIIVGNEGAGVSPDLMEQADQRVNIPIHGQAESLNVSIAAAILMYETVKK
ncbi:MULTISPECIES: TrmH family RNA methyltransferase [Gracilibacillus]|uniref:TrmH family RNA methyltransferase n=1 Tax=Gracilibacillus TaxID=74385 RepID=UPI000824E36A|nr:MULTISPECIES: RNA methyltransferase [Gracilibacillus]